MYIVWIGFIILRLLYIHYIFILDILDCWYKTIHCRLFFLDILVHLAVANLETSSPVFLRLPKMNPHGGKHSHCIAFQSLCWQLPSLAPRSVGFGLSVQLRVKVIGCVLSGTSSASSQWKQLKDASRDLPWFACCKSVWYVSSFLLHHFVIFHAGFGSRTLLAVDRVKISEMGILPWKPSGYVRCWGYDWPQQSQHAKTSPRALCMGQILESTWALKLATPKSSLSQHVGAIYVVCGFAWPCLKSLKWRCFREAELRRIAWLSQQRPFSHFTLSFIVSSHCDAAKLLLCKEATSHHCL